MTSSTKATVVILGGTGLLGYQISTIFLTEYRTEFPTVRITTREPSSEKAKQLAAKGAEVHSFSESLDTLLAGADVVVNALPIPTAVEINKDLVSALLKNGVKVFFADQWGNDFRTADFPGFMHTGWALQATMAKEQEELLQGKSQLKVLRLVTGIFLPVLFHGIDIPKNSFQWIGSPDTKFQATDIPDVGRTAARLAILALDPATASSVPEWVKVGQRTSLKEIQEAITRVKGIPAGEITVRDPAPVKQMLREKYPAAAENIMAYAGVNIADGNADLSDGGQNELVNPGQKFWKWTTVDDVVARK